MRLTNAAAFCINALTQAGYQAYAVGGCVRDSLLGLQPHDYDLCTNALPQEICHVFSEHPLIRNGEKHGTIGVVVNKEVLEITTFRTEGGYQDGRHPDWVRFVPNIEEDLARRDFTVNAMAYSPAAGYIDPWGGQQDLQNHVLRCVGDPSTRFTEDALRILRGVRFAVRFRLTPEAKTADAMAALAPSMHQLARERVFDELCKLLPLVTAQDLLTFAPVLAQVIPELAPSLNFNQNSPHHIYDVFTHTAYVTQAVPADLSLRWAALLHDVAKPAAYTQDSTGRGHFYGHAQLSAAQAQEILLRLKAPTALRERVVFLIEHHMTPFQADKKLLRRRLGQWGIEAVKQLLTLQRADFCSKGTGTPEEEAFFTQIEDMLAEVLAEKACLTVKDLAISGHDLLALGIPPGPQIGKHLAALLQAVQDETVPNEKQALLQHIQKQPLY